MKVITKKWIICEKNILEKVQMRQANIHTHPQVEQSCKYHKSSLQTKKLGSFTMASLYFLNTQEK